MTTTTAARWTDNGKLAESYIGTDSVDMAARYTVDGYPGVAFRVTGYSYRNWYEGDVLVCPDDDCDHDLSEMCWAEGGWTLVTDLHVVTAVMVGDDREHEIHVTDLTLLPADGYCRGCGQTGCGHDRAA